MSEVLEFIRQNFVKVIFYMDTYELFGDFSILDFNITLLIFGAILPIVIITISNWNTSDNAISGRESKKREVLYAKNGKFYYDKER